MKKLLLFGLYIFGIPSAQAAGIESKVFGDIGKLFGGAAGTSPVGSRSLGELVVVVVQILLLVAATFATVNLIIGGYKYVMAHGNEEQTESAKKTISGSIIGLVVITLSFAIIRIIAEILLKGVTGTGI